MPMHDWTRVEPNQFHHLHLYWIAEIAKSLNGGIMPPDYYAAAEQRVFPFTPDVLTLKKQLPTPLNGTNGFHGSSAGGGGGGIAVKTAPAKHTVTDEGDAIRIEEPMQRYLTIRHNTNDTLVAAIEIVSPSNKDSEEALNDFVRKGEAFLRRGVHLLVIDPHPPTKNDPNGIHALLWERLVARSFELPEGKRLALSSYQAKTRRTYACFVEPFAVGDALPPMPLYLTREAYVNVPLEETYLAAWECVPRPWKQQLNSPSTS